MKKSILLLLFSLLLVSNKSIAQDTIGISQYTYTISHDTLPSGSMDSVFIWIVNKSASSYTGTIELYTAVKDSASFFYFTVDSLSMGTVTIPAGDSIPKTLYPVYTTAPTQYHYDVNVIVIWPVAVGAITGDSLSYIEVITLPIGIHEIDLQPYIHAYPNPVSDHFTLENTSEIALEEVRIYNSKGQWITTLKAPQKIDTQQWKKGVYLLEMKFKNNQTHTIRVVKE
jgi:Secretion system C-terminal sorting domain